MKNSLCRKDTLGKPVIFKGRTVITTELLANAYETETKHISNNFNRNKEKFIEDKHYILLQGEALKEFKANHLKDECLKYASQLYLWTERGASRHCKILDTDKAWDQFDYLEEVYFQLKANQPMCIEDLIIANAKALKETREQAELATLTAQEAKQEIQSMREVMTLDPTAWRKETTNIINRIAQKLGGNENIQAIRKESYELLEIKAKAQLGIRLTNMKRKVLEETGSKSKADKVTKLDVIDSDGRLKEIYISIVKEMAIKYGVA